MASSKVQSRPTRAWIRRLLTRLVCSLLDGEGPFGTYILPSPKLYRLPCISTDLPTQNKQIDVAMNSALQSRGLASPSKRLSPEGQQLIGELRDMINQAKILVLTKNDGNLIQDFIWQSQHVGGGNAQKPGALIDKQGAQAHGNEAAEGLRTLGQLLISNGQFRKLRKSARSR